MSRTPLSLRRDERATAGFAIVAVALLVTGTAAILYLQAVDQPPAGEALEGAERDAVIRAESHRVSESLAALASHIMDAELGAAFDPAGGGLLRLREGVLARLAASVDQIFPRMGASGMTVGATIVDLSVRPEPGWAEVSSVFGGTTSEHLPVWLTAEGVAELSFSGPGQPAESRVVAFAGQSAAPSALPLTLASRAGAELLPGGLAERFAAQAAQHVLPTAKVSTFDGRLARESVAVAVKSVLLWAFRTSGDLVFDARAVQAAGGDGMLQAAELHNLSRGDDEAIDISMTGHPFVVEGAPPTALQIVGFSDAGLDVSVARRNFSGQELGPGIWQAVETSARGHVEFSVRTTADGRTTTVGPLRLPVAFDARSATGPMRPDLVVTPEQVAAVEQQARACGATCDVTGWLAASGLTINATANLTAALRASLYGFAAAQEAATLPPVEDANLFYEAYGPPRRALNPRTLHVNGPEVEDGARATISVDGAPAGSALVSRGNVTIARMPDGEHTVGLSVPCGSATCAGGAVVLPADADLVAEVAVAPAPSDVFLSSVTRRSVADNVTLGEAALLEAEGLLGIEPSNSGEQGGEGRLRAALLRSDELLASGGLSNPFRSAVTDAEGFLKVATLVLKAADAARRAVGGLPAPLAEAGGNAALLVLAPQARLLLVATIHGTVIARAAFSNGSIELRSPWTDGGAALSLDFRLEQVGLVATAALAGLTLGADVVRMQREAAEGDEAGLAIAFGKFAAHTADTLRQLGQGLMHVADRFLGTASVEAASATFAKASVVIGAVLFALEVADLYHDAGGNLTLLTERLIHPATVAGLVTLPSLAQSAASTAAGALLLMAGQSLAAAGPIGIAAGLFVLAGVIVLNGQMVASAAFGALNPDERVQFASAMGNRTHDLARVLASVNGANPDAADAASRASSLASARLHAAAATAAAPGERARLLEEGDAARAGALTLATRAHLERALRHAAVAAMEQMDDFASGNHTRDPGRRTEGYGMLEKVDANQGGWGRFPYGGDLVVQDASALPTHTLSREEWRALLPRLETPDLARITFGYRLTPTDGIPIRQAERFVGAVVAGGALLNDLMEEYRALAA
ncbi:MAG TPA: hypothetical protein VGB42_00290 [Candidatus Thermoplasmatota archaeon]